MKPITEIIEDAGYNLSEDLLILMESKGVSKSELAIKLNIDESRLIHVFDNPETITLRTICECCKALDIDPRIKLTDRST